MGLRTKFMVKVYVAGLYLDQKSSDASAILQADAPKRIVMHFLHGASQSQIANAFDDSFSDNAPDVGSRNYPVSSCAVCSRASSKHTSEPKVNE